MTEEYNNKNNYGYNYVRITDSNIGLNLEMLQPRDIYLTTGHTAIIAGGDYLNMGQIQTLQFNRDIDVSSNKRLGGGTYEYNLIALVPHSMKNQYIF